MSINDEMPTVVAALTAMTPYTDEAFQLAYRIVEEGTDREMVCRLGAAFTIAMAGLKAIEQLTGTPQEHFLQAIGEEYAQ